MELRNFEFLEQHRAEGSPSVYQFKTDGTSAAITFLVSAPDAFAPVELANAILGYPRHAAAIGGGSIQRILPMNLATMPSLFADAVTNFHGVGDPVPIEAASAPGYCTVGDSRWKKAFVTVLFTQPRYNLLADSEVTKEYQRFTFWEQADGIEIIQKRTGQYKFTTNTPLSGTAFPQGLTVRSPKTHYKVTWYDVPANAVMTNNNILSPNITKVMSRVNSDWWPSTIIPGDPVFNTWTTSGAAQAIHQAAFDLFEQIFIGLPPAGVAPPTPRVGFAPGTLLFTQPTVTPHVAPALAAQVGTSTGCRIPRTYDITFNLVHFDPLTDPRYPGTRGHNLCPSPSSDETASFYYEVSSNGNKFDHPTDPGRPLYESHDFDLLFRPL